MSSVGSDCGLEYSCLNTELLICFSAVFEERLGKKNDSEARRNIFLYKISANGTFKISANYTFIYKITKDLGIDLFIVL